MRVYTSVNFRPVRAECFLEAGEVFARRHLRRWHGWRNVKIGASRVDCYSKDGSRAEVEVFAGYQVRGERAITGRNLRFVIWAEDVL